MLAEVKVTRNRSRLSVDTPEGKNLGGVERFEHGGEVYFVARANLTPENGAATWSETDAASLASCVAYVANHGVAL